MRVRPLRVVAVLLTVVAIAPVQQAMSSVAAAVGGSAAAVATTTYRPTQIPLSAAPLPNSGRGQYAWSGQATRPWAQPDLYYRDQVPWSRIETEEGTFDYSRFDSGLAQARQSHGRFGFRVLAWCPGCFDNEYTHPWTKDDWTPAWLPKQGDTNVPDWNSEAFLSSWEDLMHRLGERYADDPALGWVDVGGYGKYGEWHTDGEGEPITVANAERMTRAVLDSFPKQHVVVNAFKPELVEPLLEMSPRLGLRTDCLGAPQMYSLLATAAPGSLLAERWRTAPVLSEWCHADDDTTRGVKQVTKYHVSTVSSGNTPVPYADLPPAQQAGFDQATRLAGYRYGVTSVTTPASVRPGSTFSMTLQIANTGSAPTYDEWAPVLQIRDADNALVGEQPLEIPLSAIQPGTRTRTRTINVPHLARGTYSLRLTVRDPRGYLEPMWLAETGRRQDGSYPLGRLTVS